MKLKNVSASQVKTFLMCQRKWFIEKIMKVRVPPSPSQALGTRIHANFEEFLTSGKLPNDPHVQKLIELSLPFLPQGEDADFMVERKINMATFDGGPPWIGYIDLVEKRDPQNRVVDYKTSKDFKWAMHFRDLKKDPQMTCYAKWGIDHYRCYDMSIAHLYLHTKKADIKYVPALITKDEAYEAWDASVEVVKEMVECATLTSHEDVTPDTSACNAYGGCPHRKLCGIEQFSLKSLGKKKTNSKGEPVMSKLQEKLNEMLAAKAAREGGAAPTTGIIPPDAAPREQEAAAPVEAPKKVKVARKPRKKVEVAPVVEAAPEPVAATPKPKAKKNGSNGKSFRIYIDCIPTKGEDTFTLFEDYVHAFLVGIAEDHGIDDIRLIQYGQGKAMLASAIRNHIADVPECLVVSSYGYGVNEALEVLIPHATKVVKSLRG